MVGATITGTVRDSSGASLSAATVTVRQVGNGRHPHAHHRCRRPLLCPVRADRPLHHHRPARGIRASQQSATLVVGQSLQLNFVLGVASVQQAVEVTADGSTVNTSTQQTAGLVDERQVKELPLNGRSYDGLLTLNPATVNYTSERSGGIGTSNSSVGNMFAVSGRRPQDNLFLLNGIEYTGASLINVTPGGTSGQLLGVDAVREFNVSSDTYGATYGKRTGAQVSIITHQRHQPNPRHRIRVHPQQRS